MTTPSSEVLAALDELRKAARHTYYDVTKADEDAALVRAALEAAEQRGREAGRDEERRTAAPFAAWLDDCERGAASFAERGVWRRVQARFAGTFGRVLNELTPEQAAELREQLARAASGAPRG